MSSLTFYFSGPRDLLAKLARDELRLEHAASAYDKQLVADCLFDFCGTGNAIRDWLKKHDSSAIKQQDVETFFKSSPVLKACRDICNSNKHRTLTYSPSTQDVFASATAVTSVAVDLPAGGVALESEESPKFRVKVLLNDGTKYEVVEFAKLVLNTWQAFFAAKAV